MCKDGFSDGYTGPDSCAHNVARALFETMLHLNKTIDTNEKKWTYKSVHVNEYPAHPWSLTPLKAIFHREVPVGGNANTPAVSKYNMARIHDTSVFKSTHTANYKQVIEFNQDPS